MTIPAFVRQLDLKAMLQFGMQNSHSFQCTTQILSLATI